MGGEREGETEGERLRKGGKVVLLNTTIQTTAICIPYVRPDSNAREQYTH